MQKHSLALRKAILGILAAGLLILLIGFTLIQPALADSEVGTDGWELQNPPSQEYALLGIWGSSSSDVFAVGALGNILHYDGSNWGSMTGGNTSLFIDVWGSSPSDVFAVGGNGAILHYNGTSWSSMSSGTANGLEGVWGNSPSDVFAAGENGAILHYNGTSWSAMSSGTIESFLDIWGNSPSDVFAIGWNGIILHYDGNSWSTMSSGTEERLWAAWGSSPSNVFAVGDGGTVLHYDGNTWNSMDTGISDDLYGVWGSSSSDVFAVGGQDLGTVLHYDGSNWESMDIGTTDVLCNVWGNSPYNIFAVGYYGTILHYSVPPTIASINPSHGSQGETLDVSITGTYFTGTEVSFGDGITTNSFTVDSETQITANITIDEDAEVGTRDVSVTTTGGTGTQTGGFTVEEKESNGEAGGCSCSSASLDVSAKELAIGWGIIGLCWGGGYYLVRRSGKREI